MLRGGEPSFIDYQGGRKGALCDDVASLLYDAKADLPPEVGKSSWRITKKCPNGRRRQDPFHAVFPRVRVYKDNAGAGRLRPARFL